MRRSPLVALVGPHNSGKTGLLVYLARALSREGLQVGVIKRAARPLQFDQAGKDSARYLAGASRVITQAPGLVYTQSISERRSTPIELAREHGRGIDWWLVESYEPEALPWVLVSRRGQISPTIDRYCVATFGVRPAGANRPHFTGGRRALLLSFLKNKLGKGRGHG